MHHGIVIAVLNEHFARSLLDLMVNLHFLVIQKPVNFVDKDLEFDRAIYAEALLDS